MSESGQTPRMTCDTFESTLGEFLEGGLTERERALSERHLSGCAPCRAMVADLDRIVHAAGVLPPIAPSRDLWPDIEARLDPAVLRLPTGEASTRQSRTVSWRALAAAAAVLVTASAGATWTLARNTAATVEVPALALNRDTVRGGTEAADAFAQTMATAPAASLGPTGDSVGEGTDAPDRGRITLVADRAPTAGSVTDSERMITMDTLYGREIAKLRTIAESQLDMLDSSTVSVVRRNLDIIDNAILESRAALESDPNSGFLLEQLDRAYERKVDLLRRLAFL